MTISCSDPMTDAEWLTNDAEITESLYELENGDTFAVKVNRSWGTSIKHVTIEKGPYPESRNYYDSSFAEPYDVVLKGEERRDPSAEFSDTTAISYDPDSHEVYLKVGIGRFQDIKAITTDTLAVSYESDVMPAARCECGQTTRLPVDESDLPIAGDGMINSSDGFLTPCCRSSEWSTTLVER